MADVVRVQRERLQAENALLERRVLERTADLEQARYEALLMLAVAAEYRDEDTHRHTQRVGRNAAFVADRLGLSAESVELIRAAAPLHDVGKIGVSDSIVLKPDRLTPTEAEVMRRHVMIGASILGASAQPLFHVASEIALTHHERWDGSGYLHGLSGEDIPLAGRIVAVIDVFDALTHSRPYKDPWPVERALEEIRCRAGSHFDPDVVAAFEAIDTGLLLADA
jgi:putative two-component system response regulator